MSNLEEKLYKKILELQDYISEINKIFDENLLDKENEVSSKQKKLKAIESKLLICQSEKEQILKDLDTEIKKVKNSNLSNEEKSKQIVALTTNHHQQFAETCQQLSNAWQSYHQTQQKVIEVLESKRELENEAIKRLGNTKKNQFVIIFILLVMIMVFFFTWLFTKQKNKLINKN